MNKGLIADIQRSSLHDGPGVRTTVFFKGCPLNCKWCHNPECISYEPQTLIYPEKCLGCGKCSQGCYSGARVLCGKEYTAKELLQEIRLDKDYYGKKGGVTFSGGEPFAQAEFLNEIIDLCKEEEIHCAVETSMIIYKEELLKKLDLIMADLKIWDDQIHKEYTGVSNRKIKVNLCKANSLGIPMIIRTPVIPGIEQGIKEISDFLKDMEHVVQYELLPYHPLGVSKQLALGLEKTEFKVPSKEMMEEVRSYEFDRR